MGRTAGMSDGSVVDYCDDIIRLQQDDVRRCGCEPLQCPRCGHFTLWPELYGYRNFYSLYFTRETICSICIGDEKLQIKLNIPERNWI